MIYNFGNVRKSSIIIHKELMNMTSDIYPVKNEKTKGFFLENKRNITLSKERANNNYSGSSFISKNYNKNKKINNFNMHLNKNNNKINKRSFFQEPKNKCISMINLKKSNLNRKNNRNMMNKRNSLIKLSRNLNKDFSTNNLYDGKLIDNFSFNDNFRPYSNISLNIQNLNPIISKEKVTLDNLDINFEKIKKRKINKFRNSSIKYIKYNNQENQKNNENDINYEKSKIISRNDSSKKKKYSYTYNHSKTIKRKNGYELKDILNLLNAKNIDDSIEKINKLLVYKNFIHQLKNIYLESNNQKNKNEIKLKDILFWLSSRKEEKNKYEDFCKEIMNENNIDKFENFKIFLTRLINDKMKNKDFVKGIQQIFDGFNKLQPKPTIYRNLSQRSIRNNLIITKEDDII